MFLSLKNVFNIKSIIKFLLLNESPFSGHLWYLGAILYVLIIIYLYEKKYTRRNLYILIPLLLLGDLILGKYSLAIFNKEIPFIIVRNFIFVGFPYFLIGDLLFQNQKKIKLNSRKNFLLIIVFSLLTLLEKIVLVSHNVNAARDHYISTTFLAIFVFIVFLKNEKAFSMHSILKKISYLGCSLSLYIFIIHPLIITILNKFVSIVIKNNTLHFVYQIFSPFIILIISTLLSYYIYKIERRHQKSL